MREERERLALSQRAFAELGRVSKNTQLSYEMGASPIPLDYLLGLEVHGVDIVYVVAGTRAAQGQPEPDGDDRDDVSIDSIDFDYGLGGTFADIEERSISVEKVKFSRGWLRKFTHSPPELLVTTTGVGDSMEPLISDHDVVIIDRSERLKDAMGDKTWAIIFGGVGMIKRLRPMPDGTVKIMSVNRTYPDELATDNDLHIVGRVVAVVKRY